MLGDSSSPQTKTKGSSPAVQQQDIPVADLVQEWILPDENPSLATNQSADAVLLKSPYSGAKDAQVINACAPLLQEGKHLVIVAEDKVAAKQLINSWKKVGLGELCLDLGGAASELDVLRDLRATMGLGKPESHPAVERSSSFSEASAQLNAHAAMMKSEIGHSGFTASEAISRLITLKDRSELVENISAPIMKQWTRQEFESAKEFAAKIQASWQTSGPIVNNAAFGVGQAPADPEKFGRDLESSRLKIDELQARLTPLINKLGLPSGLTEEQIEKTLQSLAVIDSIETNNGKTLKQFNPESDLWMKSSRSIESALQTAIFYSERMKPLWGHVNLEQLRALDLDGIGHALEAHESRGWLSRIFDSEYQTAISNFQSIVKMPEELGAQLERLEGLKELKALDATHRQGLPIIEKLLDKEQLKENSRDPRYWYRSAQLCHALAEFGALTQDNPAQTRLNELLRTPGQVYEQSKEIKELCGLFVDYKNSRNTLLAQLEFDPAIERTRFLAAPFASQEDLLSKWTTPPAPLHAIDDYEALQQTAKKRGWEFILDAARTGGGHLVESLERGWFRLLTNDFVSTHPAAARFVPAKHELTQARYGVEYEQLRTSEAYAIADKHWKLLPNARRSSDDQQLISLLASLDSGTLIEPGTVEAVIERFGELVRNAKPIVIMTPESMSTYARCMALNPDVILACGKIKVTQGIFAESKLVPFRRKEIENNYRLPLPQVPDDTPTVSQISRDPEGAFINHLAQKLTERGMNVCAPEGGLGAGISLGILNPDNQKEILLGIQTDGSAYAREDSSVTREILLPEALKEAGWNLQRVWLLDYLQHEPEVLAEIERNFCEAIEKRHGKISHATAGVEIPRATPSAANDAAFQPYTYAVVDVDTNDRHMLYGTSDVQIDRIASILRQVVEQEAPIKPQELYRRMAQLGRLRLNDDLTQLLTKACSYALRSRILVERDGFLFVDDETEIVPRSRAEERGKLKNFSSIAPAEIDAALRKILAKEQVMSRDELISTCVKLFGFKTIPNGARWAIERQIDRLVRTNEIVERRSGKLRLT